jgi:photosystem II stability/assembly factor-like uncharacterized protein
MKSFILLLGVSFCLNFMVNAQSWRKAYDTPVVSIQSGYYYDQNNVWLVGSLSTVGIYKSTDGGMTWVNKYYPTDTSSHAGNDISFVNPTTLFVGCNKGKILKTTDGGDSWQAIYTSDLTYANSKIYFFDANSGYSLATNGSATKIFKTTDGGINWTITATIAADMEAMDFYSPTVGIATGGNGNLWYTSNGSTWTKGTTSGWPQISYSRTDQWGVKFINATTAVSCGWGSIAIGFEPTIFLKTTDGGASWVYQNQADQNRTYVNFKSIYFKDLSNGIAVGGSTYPGTVICRTSDGGANWIPLSAVAGFSPNIVMGLNDRVIVSGNNGDIVLSSDFGNSWNIINKKTAATLSSMNIINNSIYACGVSGSFYKSTDLGITFDLNYMTAANKCLWSKAIQFLDENLGYAVSQKGQALKTTNAGVSWTQILPDSASNFISNQGLYFINGIIGFVAGNIASNVDIIYKTTDGGGSWSKVQNLAFQNLNCIGFADDMHGAAGGNKSAILYTTDQGTTWKTAAVNTADQLAINAIKFYNGLNGIAVGSSIILKTSDGGATWNRITFPSNATLTSVCFSGSTFYTAGSKYCFKSTDEGNTWQNIMDTVFAAGNGFTTMNSVALDKLGNIWIAGGSGIITNSPATGIFEDSFEPNSFALQQNYPNPFNPSTTISFTNNKNGLVTLKLFDILGKEVRLIFNGEMTAGQHKINFNAGTLASGTYIYSLKVNDQFTCRKMTLLK